jgi:hypothetical protein
MIISRWMFLRIRSVSDNICKEIKTCILSSKYFSEGGAVYETRWRMWYSQEGHRWQYNAAHALSMFYNWGYKYTLRICNIDCICTATMVATAHLAVTIYILCLSGWCNLKNQWRRKTRIDKTVTSELLCLLLRLFAENELSATTGMRVLVRLISNSNLPSGPVFVCFLC